MQSVAARSRGPACGRRPPWPCSRRRGPGGRRGRGPRSPPSGRPIAPLSRNRRSSWPRSRQAARSPRRRRPCRASAARARGRRATACATRAGRRSARTAGRGIPASTIRWAGRAVLVGQPLAGQVGPLAVDHHARSRPRRCRTSGRSAGRPSAPSPRACRDMITTSTPARWQASSAARLARSEKLPSGSRKSDAARAEQGPVEVRVDAAQRHARTNLGRAGDASWRLVRPDARVPAAARRRGSSTSPTTRSSPARAAAPRSGRSPTDWRWSSAGFDLLDVGAVAARSGPPVATRPTRRPGWSRRSSGLAAEAGVPGARRHVLARGRARGARRRGGGDQRHRRRRARDARAGRRARLRLRAHAHRGPAAGRPRRRPHYERRRRAPEASGSPSASSAPLEAGVERRADRPRPGARLRPHDRSTASRSCAASASCASSGARCSWRSRARTSSGAMLAGSWEGRLDPDERGPATLAATALAVGGRGRAAAPARRRGAGRDAHRGGDRRNAGDPRPELLDAPPLAWERLSRPARPTTAWSPPASRRPAAPRSRRHPPALRSRLARRRCSRGPGSPASTRIRSRRSRPPAAADVIVTSGTASGKSLSFNLPVLDALVRRPEDAGRSTSTRPRRWPRTRRGSSPSSACADLRHAIYDGDTPRDDRPAIRRRSNLVLTNPDMLNMAVLAHHKGWGDFLDQPRLGRRRRGAHLPRGLRLARRQRPAPAAPGRPRLRRRPAIHLRLGDDRQPGRAGRAALTGPRVRARRLRRRAEGRGAGSRSGTRR